MIAKGDSLFAATNATIGTSRPHAISTGFSALKGLLFARNPATNTTLMVPKYLRLIPSTTPAGQLHLDFAVVVDPNSRIATLECTISNASPAVVTTVSAHSRVAGDPVIFTTTGTLPNPLVVGTTYFVGGNGGLTANAFRVSATAGGADINTTTNGTGVHTYTAAGNESRTPVSLVKGVTGSRTNILVDAFAGDVTLATASATARTVARCRLQTGVHVAGDEMVLQFGGRQQIGSPTITAIRATAPARFVAQVAPCIVVPGETLVIHRWAVTEATAPSYEYEFVWAERS